MAHVELIRVLPMIVVAFNCFDEDGSPEKEHLFAEWLAGKGLVDPDQVEQDGWLPGYGFNNPNPGRRPKGYGYEFWMPIDPAKALELGDMDDDEALPPNCAASVKNFLGGTYFVTRHAPQPVSLMQGYEETLTDDVFPIPEDMELSGVAWDLFLNPAFKDVEGESMKWLGTHGYSGFQGRWLERANAPRSGRIDVYLPMVPHSLTRPCGTDFRFFQRDPGHPALAERYLWKDRDTTEVVTEPTVEGRAGFTVAGLMAHHMDKGDDVASVWQRFKEHWHTQLRPLPAEDEMVGVAIPSEETGSWQYLAGVRVPTDATVPNGLHAYRAPDGTYAVAETTAAEIEYTYYTIYKNWPPDSPYERDLGRPAVDVLPPNGDGATIWIPVKQPE